MARSSLTQARKWLGAEPVEWLFRKTGTQWGAERYPEDALQDYQVFAVDGGALELREHFGSGNTPTDRETRFPLMRLVALMNVRWPLILIHKLALTGTAR